VMVCAEVTMKYYCAVHSDLYTPGYVSGNAPGGVQLLSLRPRGTTSESRTSGHNF